MNNTSSISNNQGLSLVMVSLAKDWFKLRRFWLKASMEDKLDLESRFSTIIGFTSLIRVLYLHQHKLLNMLNHSG
jgi:hypothetical protein